MAEEQTTVNESSDAGNVEPIFSDAMWALVVFIFFFGGTIGGCTLGDANGHSRGRDQMWKEAIRRDYAEYHPEKGYRRWVGEDPLECGNCACGCKK